MRTHQAAVLRVVPSNMNEAAITVLSQAAEVDRLVETLRRDGAYMAAEFERFGAALAEGRQPSNNPSTSSTLDDMTRNSALLVAQATTLVTLVKALLGPEALVAYRAALRGEGQ